MFELPIPEIVLFFSVAAVYFAAGVVGIVQLRSDGEKYKRLLLPLVCLAVTIEAVMLIFRAVAIKAIPLTGLFESMIVLTIVINSSNSTKQTKHIVYYVFKFLILCRV